MSIIWVGTSEMGSRQLPFQTVRDITRSRTPKKKTPPPAVTLPPLCPKLPPLPSVFVSRPLFSRIAFLPSPPSSSAGDPPHHIAQVGPRRSIEDTKWKVPHLMPALTDSSQLRHPAGLFSLSEKEKDELSKITARKEKNQRAVEKCGKATKPNKHPLTGHEVFQMFTQKEYQAELKIYYLKEADEESHRPYDLEVVQFDEAGSEHYVFSPLSVLHATETGYGGVVSLADWNIESVLWTSLKEIPFFRDYRLKKTFTWWNINIREMVFQRRCEALQDQLLVAVPQFRSSLHLIAGLTEALNEAHWLPHDESQTYTLMEFKNVLTTRSQEGLHVLETLSQHRTAILNAVKENCVKSHQELQLHLKYAKKLNKCYEPIYLHLAHKQDLEKELARAETALQKLGIFGSLVDRMIVQSLVTVIRQDVRFFLSNFLKRDKSPLCSLFYTELCFDASSQLTVAPPLRLFQEAVSEALLTVVDSIVQMCDTCGFFLEISSSVDTDDESSDSDQDSSPDLGCIKPPSITGDKQIRGGRRRRRKFCCLQLLMDQPALGLVPPNQTQSMVLGNAVHGCFHPLTKAQLESQIRISDLSEVVERESMTIMKEAELEILQLCESSTFLVDSHSFIRQCTGAFLESMKGQPALQYEEHILNIRRWTQQINLVPSTISTSNQVFIIYCAHLTETLGRHLRDIEQEILRQLVEQIKLRSENLVSDLEKNTAELKTEPIHLDDFSEYSLMVTESWRMHSDTQKQLVYIHSLQETVGRTHRQMTEEERTLEEKMLGLWDCFTPVLEKAERIVWHRLPTVANALDTMVPFLVSDLKSTVSKATCGPSLDPTQSVKETASKLKNMWTHMLNLNEKLEELNRIGRNLHEPTVDLTSLTPDIQKITACKDLWELKAAYTAWTEEWKLLNLSEVVVLQGQEKIAKWKEQTLSIASIIPTHDAVLQDTLGNLENLSFQLSVVAQLQSPTLKHRHWSAISKGMGTLYVQEKTVTVADLMSEKLQDHQEVISKICRDAQAERDMEETFKELQRGWKAKLFQLERFTHCVLQRCRPQRILKAAGIPTEGFASRLQAASRCSCAEITFTIIGLEIHFAEIENDLLALSIMLKSPHSLDFRQQLEEWVQSLQDLENLLDLFERFQQIWTFLMLNEKFLRVQRVDLLEKFKPVDETFKQIMRGTTGCPEVLRFVHSTNTNGKFHGKSLCRILIGGLSTMESISNQMGDFLDAIRKKFPRLWFLSDREVTQLLSFHPVPSKLLPYVRKCFRGIHSLELQSETPSDTRDGKPDGVSSGIHRQIKVLGVFSSLQEHISFLSALESNPNALDWFCQFEKQLQLTMMELIKQCNVAQYQLQQACTDLACDEKSLLQYEHGRQNIECVLALFTEFPLQCLLVAEEAVWSSFVLKALRESSPVKLRHIKAYNSAKLRNLCRFIRDRYTGADRESLVSRYMMVCLGASVQLTMNHAQQLTQLMEVRCDPESSYEWLTAMKYHINSEDQSLKCAREPACYVDVFGHRLQYGYEYFGPEDLVMVQTPSTDRAILGILLALTSYRCGFVSGPCMSGKKNTVLQFGKALARQVVTVQCYPSMRLDVVQQMLFGALLTGAWLLFDSVDLLTQGVLSSLGQHLLDIHQCFNGFTENGNQRVRNKRKDQTSDKVGGFTKTVQECRMILAGKDISANLDYGCVVISSTRYTFELPESLRFAMRPVALTHPSYRIIAEVTLTSIGFSDAMPLSQRLVSLINLAQDCHCLPHFITDNQSCFLVVLQKIISASEIHLNQIVRQQKMSDEARGAAAENTDPVSSENVSATDSEAESEEFEKRPTLHSSRLLIMQSLMEERALVEGIISVLLPSLYDHKKALRFYTIFKDAFPTALEFPLFQQYFEEEKNIKLKEAITEELQWKQLHPDKETISNALTLYQTMESSQAVLLIGPSGSGKTTCHSALAGALNSLAAKAMEFENDSVTRGDAHEGDPQIWNSVDTVVLFPNAMSHEELFGSFCEKRGWQDGAITKVVRDSGQWEHTRSKLFNNKRRRDQTPTAKWLVMDGEPVGQPGWLDYLTTLCSPEDPFLLLSSGEKLVSTQSSLKLLMEITDLSDATPSAVTRCSFIHFTGSDLWKAVWKKEMDVLHSEYKLDQGTLKMWNRLAEDLFSSTLGQMALTSAVQREGHSLNSSAYGLQEITSFGRILTALLQNLRIQVEKAEATLEDKADSTLHGASTSDIGAQSQLTRNLFLLAYIWGFGGHLHPRKWPHLDLIVRKVLFSCRYNIMVPDDENVFEHFFNLYGKMCPKKTLLTNNITPKFGKYTFLLSLMLEANQPVLLAGDPSSGKTSLCQSLLSFDKPSISLTTSPSLSSRDLRTILRNISCPKYCKDSVGSATKEQRLLLFVDDLHEAPCDVFGKTSSALESLRQSISKGQILTLDTYHFKPLCSGLIGYMATCCASGSGHYHPNGISSRLSRLFSIFVLPSPSTDIILSVHSPRLQAWLKGMPLQQSGENMACCVVTATKTLYHAVCDQFQPSEQRPFFMFSHHDLQKVFQGMYLWRPSIQNTKNKVVALPGFPPDLPETEASVLKVAHLWMHECMRTFHDRCSEEEGKTLVSLIAKVAATEFVIRSDTARACEEIHQSPETLSLSLEPEPAAQSDLKEDETLPEPFLLPENHSSEVENLTAHPPQLQIFQHFEETVTGLVYGPELSETWSPIDPQHGSKWSFCYKEQDLDGVLRTLPAILDRIRDDKGPDVDNNYITSRYMLHRQRVSQLLHILRALLTPKGHGVLIGADKGTGRKTAVRLAADLTGYPLMELHSGNESKLHEILKEAGNQSRVDGVHVIILVHEDISQAVRDELLAAMERRTFPALYTEEELKNLVSSVMDLTRSRQYLMDSWMLEKYLSKVHKNVHVFLMMSSTSDGTIVTHRQMTKTLSLSCCVELYQPWCIQSLARVAAQFLKTSPHKKEIHGSLTGLSVAMAGVHQSARRYASVLLKAQPFNPMTYMEFISHFGYLCKHLLKQRKRLATRVAYVLAHVDILNAATLRNKVLLEIRRKKVADAQQRETDLIKAIDDQTTLFDEVNFECAEVKNKQLDVEEQFNKAQHQLMPVFLSCKNLLDCLDFSDLEEVRCYRDPPVGVVTVMDAICLLFNHPTGWESARLLLRRPNFFQELEFFDRFTLTQAQLWQLRQIITNPDFVPESVRDVSKACESLCRWVTALYGYYSLRHQLLVRRQLEEQDREVRAQLHQAKRHKEEEFHHLADLKRHLLLVQKLQKKLLPKLHQSEKMDREFTATAEQLEENFQDWRAAAKEAELQKHNLSGDALVLAAVVAYLGPFPSDVRTELLTKWRNLCETGSINLNPEDPRTSLFPQSNPAPPSPPRGFPIPVFESSQLALGRALGLSDLQIQNTVSSRVVVQLLLWGYRNTQCQRWPLLVDTQQHQERSSQSWFLTGDDMDPDTDCEMVICGDDPELLEKLDQAAEQGFRVLLTGVEHVTPSSQLLDRLAPPAGCCPPGMKQQAQPPHPDFRLFLSTNLPVRMLSREIHPSILALVHVVDLSLSSAEMEELMLTLLLRSECEGLLIQHRRLQNEKQLLQEKLVREEDALMNHLLQSKASRPPPPDFLTSAAVFQEAMKTLRAEIQQLSEELEHHEALVNPPRQLVRMAASLYQALQEVSRLSPAYYFSLRDFIEVMQDIFIEKGRPLVPFAIGKEPTGLKPEITNKMVSRLLLHYRPLLFKSHFSVLKLLVSVALLQHNQLCSEGERAAFLTGLQDIGHQPCLPAQTLPQTTTPLPSWTPPQTHPELLSLDRVPAFTGLLSSLSTHPTQWQEYLRLPASTVVGAVPCLSHSHLSLVQRALLWKTLNPNRLEGLADMICASQLCLPVQTVRSETPHTGNPGSLSRYLLRHEGAITLTLPSPGGDDRTSTRPLHLINTLAECVGETGVKVISLGALCGRDVLLSALDKAVDDGHWLVFSDCHLLERWDGEVVARLGQLISSFKEARGPTHPGVRLWFVTQECKSHHIPVTVRMRCLPLVCDAPWDLKEELSRSLHQVVCIARTRSPSGGRANNMELLLRCAVFHSVLLQRQTCQYLGQGRIYNWDQGDLLALVEAHNCISRLCPVQTKALQYLAGDLVHGGHALDSADLELVENTAKACLSRMSPLWGRGPHVLSDIIRNPGQFGLTGLLQILDQGLQDAADITDPAVLGFDVVVAAEMIKINSHHLNLLLQASQNPLGTARSSRGALTLPTSSQARDRLLALKSYLTHRREGRGREAVSHGSLSDFLRAEWEELVDTVSSLLSQLQQSVQHGTPTFLSLAALSRLERRAELLSAYVERRDTSDPPGAYRLAAFSNARGFLVAIMRKAARVNLRYISDVELQFQVLSDSRTPDPPPVDAVYLCGLELRGASWDPQLGALQGTDSPQPGSLPLVCVTAHVRSITHTRDNVPDLEASSSTAPPQLPVLHCPLYLDEGREPGDSGLADAQIITKIPLHASLNPVLCSLRRVRLVSLL
ncbi:dynein heavy chain domain-containing protein 1 [Limanda limanda]|uniref:dynein heavy chain domain-containing protein 1 n=1 Tax=Limanda limanda TaxID=27771 RepID=UPI0029C5FCD0|nr:dynein heavy chain domain-containing protein 1 [Limanda limanda]